MTDPGDPRDVPWRDADDDSPAAPEPRRGLAFVTRRPVAITMFMVAIAVFGLVSLGKLPMDLLPEISYPTLTVRTAWPGAAPEDVEDRVSVRVQETLATLPDLVRTSSVSRVGYSDVVLEYEWGTDMTFAVQDVRDQLDSIFLPQSAERPIILRYDPNLDPTLRLGVRAPRGESPGTERDLIHLRWIAEHRIKRELETMPGVAAVEVRGGLEEEIRVRVDPRKLDATGIPLRTIADRLAAENLNASGGVIREGSTDFLVRTLNEFQSLAEIEQLPIVRRGETSVRLGEVAEVESTHRKREVVTRLDGGEAVEVAIFREAGANIVDVADRVKREVFGTQQQQAHIEDLEEKGGDDGDLGGLQRDRELEDFLAWRLRRDAEIEVLSDQSTFIRAAIEDVRSAAVLGALLAVIVMWFFLRRFSATAIVALAIPISVIVTFAPMFLAGVSLNIMSLGGLALGVGMLVDNAIVVLESITRCREEGDSLAGAAVRGVREVAGAIVASTLTTVAVFAPIVFVHGIAGQIFGDQALTVVSSLIVSLVVAVFFIPMLASRPLLAGVATGTGARPPSPFAGLEWSWATAAPNLLAALGRSALWVATGIALVGMGLFWIVGRALTLLTWPLRRAFDLAWGGVERVYPLLLRGALGHPLLVVAATIALGWAATQRLGALGLELLPEIHQGEFTAHVGLSVESPLANTDEVLSELAGEIGALDEVALTALVVGVEEDTLTRDIEGEHTGRLTVRLVEGADAKVEDRVLAEVRDRLLSHPEVRTLEVSRPTPFAIDAPLAVEVSGYDLGAMRVVAEEVRERLDALPALTDVRSTMRVGHPEARVVFDREKTLEFGLDLATVSNLLRDQLLGNVSTRLTQGEERIDIRVQGDEDVLSTLEEVLELSVDPEADRPVPLSSVARIELVRGPAEIRRIGNSRAIVISASGKGLDLGGLNQRIEDALADLRTPDDVFVELGGQKRELEAGRASMIAALLLAIFLVYVVMASLFESLLQPLIIMLTVPLAGVGVVFALDLLGVSLSVIVFIGAILLAGIVVNNAIVLVDRINQKRGEGLPLLEAVEEAGRARLRPILMTTLTTALGLLPLTGWLDHALEGVVDFVMLVSRDLLTVLVAGGLGEILSTGGAGAELRAPMAITVIAGLLSSTLLTLIVIPVVYSVVYRPIAGREEGSA